MVVDKIALMKEVGKRIRKIRMDKGLQQNQLSKEFECVASKITNIEKGTRDPGVDFYFWFAERTGCSLDYIIRGIDRKEENIKIESMDENIIDVYKKLVDIHFSSDVIQGYLNNKLKTVCENNNYNVLTEFESKIIDSIRHTDEKYHDDIYINILRYYKNKNNS